MRRILHTFLFIPALLMALELTPLFSEDASETGCICFTRAERNFSIEGWGLLEAEEGERSEENEESNEDTLPYIPACALTEIHHTHRIIHRLKVVKTLKYASPSHTSFRHLRAPPSLI